MPIFSVNHFFVIILEKFDNEIQINVLDSFNQDTFRQSEAIKKVIAQIYDLRKTKIVFRKSMIQDDSVNCGFFCFKKIVV